MIPLHQVFMPNGLDAGLSQVLHSGQIGYGEHTKLFEKNIQTFIGNELFLSISTNPVLVALNLIGIKEGDEVIASPMSCLTTTQPIALLKAKAVWADIDPLTGTIDPNDVRKKITSKTKAILHYHWGGYPGYIDEINEIGKSSGVFVIEEASMAFGSEYKGKMLGNTGSDIVCFSFSPVRLPNTIDGAGLAFNCKRLSEKAYRYRDLGVDRSTFRDELGEISNLSDVCHAGNSSLLSNVSAFIGLQQMTHINELLDKQRQNAKEWHGLLESEVSLGFLDDRKEIKANYWVFSFLIGDRNNWLTKFRESGYGASKLHLRNDLYSVFNNQSNPERLRGVDEFSMNQINIPSGWWVNPKDIACAKL